MVGDIYHRTGGDPLRAGDRLHSDLRCQRVGDVDHNQRHFFYFISRKRIQGLIPVSCIPLVQHQYINSTS